MSVISIETLKLKFPEWAAAVMAAHVYSETEGSDIVVARYRSTHAVLPQPPLDKKLTEDLRFQFKAFLVSRGFTQVYRTQVVVDRLRCIPGGFCVKIFLSPPPAIGRCCVCGLCTQADLGQE